MKAFILQRSIKLIKSDRKESYITKCLLKKMLKMKYNYNNIIINSYTAVKIENS